MPDASVVVEFDRTGEIEAQLRESVYGAELATAKAIAKDARRRAPQHERRRIPKSVRVDKGSLETLLVRVGLGGFWAYIGRFAEFGTVKEAAHPFMTPAIEGQRAPHDARLIEAINDVVEE